MSSTFQIVCSIVVILSMLIAAAIILFNTNIREAKMQAVIWFLTLAMLISKAIW